ncbi:acyltransferase family protein [Taibaiella chishuiensis]|nr:acyltransferase [Taibaiella chishuiensis]
MNAPNVSPTRNRGIDMLRGFSILSVVLLHLNIHFHLTDTFLKTVLPKKVFMVLFWSGYYGVIIFFTLSGYLITQSILRRWGEPGQIRLPVFYRYRAARILPPLLALLLILSLLHIFGVTGFVIDNSKTSLAEALVAALTFHINWLEMRAGYLPANWDVLWTISIEEVFYLVFPLLGLLLRRRLPLLLLLSCGVLIAPWARTHLFIDNELGDRNNLACIDALSLGCITALIADKLATVKIWKRLYPLLGWALVVFVIVFRNLLFKSGITALGLDVSILSLGVCGILLRMHNRPETLTGQGFPGLRWLADMGQYSYEIYLSHMFVVIAAAQLYQRFGVADTYLPFVLLLATIACYLLGKLAYTCFSEPVNRALRRKADKNMQATKQGPVT